MDTVTVVDEFECQFKCIGNKSCKSFNVRTDGNNAQRHICELNNKTRKMKPGDLNGRKDLHTMALFRSVENCRTFTFFILVILAGANLFS